MKVGEQHQLHPLGAQCKMKTWGRLFRNALQSVDGVYSGEQSCLPERTRTRAPAPCAQVPCGRTGRARQLPCLQCTEGSAKAQGSVGAGRGQGRLLPEEQQHSLWEGLEVVVPVYLGPVHQGDLSKHLQITQGIRRACPQPSPA